MNKEKWIILILLLSNIICLIFTFNKKTKTVVNKLNDITKKVMVDIKGAVKNPGLKVLDVGSTVSDLITLSGGLLDNADTSLINLSKKLADEMVIIVYTTDEVQELKKGDTSIKVIDKECICPKVTNDACINHDTFVNEEQNNQISGQININTATKEELMTLTGIGETKANAIIAYRNVSPFKTIEEITNVNGIGASTYEKIKNNITI